MDLNGETDEISGWGETELETGLDPFKKTSIKIGSYDSFIQYKRYYYFTLQMGKPYAKATLEEVRFCSSYNIK